MDGFPHLDALLQLRLLQLDADALLQLVDVANGIEPSTVIVPAVGPPQSLDAFHRRRLAGAVRSDQPEDLAVVDLERHFIDRDGAAVGLADP